MDSSRQQKFSSMLIKELGNVFQKEGYSMFQGAMVTITTIRVSPDLGYAKVYLSVFGQKDKEKVLAGIRKDNSKIRFKLGQKIRNDVRVIPELNFFLDDSLDYAEDIDRLFDDIKKKEKGK